MKKAFLMIEVVVTIMGLSILLASMILVFKESETTKPYLFIPVSQKCEILCALQKLQP